MAGVVPTQLGRTAPLPKRASTVGVSAGGDDLDWGASGVGVAYSGPDQWKQPVRCATTAALTISTGLNAGDTVDGVALAAGDRVLVKDQGTASQNGIWVADASPYRAADMDDDPEVVGALVYVVAGTANAGKVFVAQNATPPVVDTDPITFAAFAPGSGATGTLSTVEEVDGSPTDSAVTKLVFPNGTLSIASHVATYTPGGAGGGALVLLEQHAASASASLDFTSFISSTYDEYLIEILGLTPATNNADLLLRMGTGAGPTWDSGNNYTFEHFVWRAGGSAVNGTAATSSIRVSYYQGGADHVNNATAAFMVNGRATLFLPQSTTFYKRVEGRVSYIDISPFRVTNEFQGSYDSTTAITGIQFLMSSGNITAGTIRAYGLAK